MARKVQLSELPKWFKLAKYNFTSELDLAGWHDQIQARRQLYTFVEFGLKYPSMLEGDPKFKGDLLKVVLSNPCVDVNTNPLFNGYMRVWPANQMPEDWIESSLPVRQVTKRNLRGKRNPEERILLIDISMPDEILVAQFEQLLPKLRAPIKQKAFSKWVRYSVLPYMDLEIWAKAFNKKITDEIMARAIFPEYRGNALTIVRHTRPLTEKLKEQRTLKLLLSSIAVERQK